MDTFKKNFGKLVSFDDDGYTFENTRLELILETSYCDTWECEELDYYIDYWLTDSDSDDDETDSDSDDDEDTSSGSDLASMIGKNIIRVLISYFDEETGYVTIMSEDKVYNMKKFQHIHNGYYPSSFCYEWKDK